VSQTVNPLVQAKEILWLPDFSPHLFVIQDSFSCGVKEVVQGSPSQLLQGALPQVLGIRAGLLDF